MLVYPSYLIRLIQSTDGNGQPPGMGSETPAPVPVMLPLVVPLLVLVGCMDEVLQRSRQDRAGVVPG